MSIQTRRARQITMGFLGVVIISLIIVVAARIAPAGMAAEQTGEPSPQSTSGQERQEQLRDAYGRMPMSFEVNRGQSDASVRFQARGHGYQVYLTEREAVLMLYGQGCVDCVEDRSVPGERRVTRQGMLRLTFGNSRPASSIVGAGQLRGRSNYLIGDDPSKWVTDIPTYARVEYEEVYPGISLAYYGNQQRLEYDFIVRPGADPSRIAVKLEGADRIELTDEGDLLIEVGGSRVIHRSPVSYEETGGERRRVRSRYVLNGDGSIGFEVEDRDPGRKLIIDPVIDYSTFFGGIGSDEGFAIDVDASGSAYITGTTYSNNFNTFAPLQPINRGGKYDAFVSKIDPSGSALVYSTYLGGGGEDEGRGIAVDAAGNAWIAGITNSSDFTVRNAYQPQIKSIANEVFVARINAAGSDLVFSTYLGGTGNDQAFGIALDGAGDAYVTGSTDSSDFPVRNALQANYQGGTDAFLTKIKGDGTDLVYSTYLGGSALDEAYGVVVDIGNNVYLTGATASTDFQTANPIQAQNRGGGSDAFVTKVNSQGSGLVYSTYLGGSAVDVAYGIALDANLNAYVTGHTFSTDFNIFNALQSTNRGNADAFVSRLSLTGATLVYSTYLGGSGGDFGRGIVVDGGSNAYVVGRTISTDFNTRNALQPTNRGEFDAFVSKVNFTGGLLVYSTYLGGASDDLGYGIAIDGAGNAYVTGDTRSTDFNTKNPLQAENRGGLDAFVSKIDVAGASLVYSTYLGGSGEDLGLSLALDTAGNAFITGFTSSNDFATRSPIQAISRGGLEVFVTKIFADASDIAFNTYFGGNGSDTGNAIAVDSGGNSYVVGATTSTNLPTRTPIQGSNRGSLDAFIVKFNPSGSNIVYATYLGGQFGDSARSVAVNIAGSAFIAGNTFSNDFPTVSPLQATNNGEGDAFVARLNPTGTALVYSSYLGGTGTDEASGVAIDAANNAYLVGNTASTDFNIKSPLQGMNRGGQDAFVAKVSSDGSALVWSTYLGGQRADIGNGIAIDSAGGIYITGSTASQNFPLQNSFQPGYGGGDLDAFISKIDNNGTTLVYSSYLGGSLAEVGNAVAVDSNGNCFVTGVTASLNFPIKNPLQAENRGGNEAFIVRVNSSGSSLNYSTYLGGTGDDRGAGIAVDVFGTAYVTGATASADFNIQFPLLGYGGGTDVFVAKILGEATLSLTPATLEIQPDTTTGMTVTLSGPQTIDTMIALSSSNPEVVQIPSAALIPAGSLSAGFTVTALQTGGPVTITATLPAGQGGATATATVTVTTTGRVVQAASVRVAGGGLVTVPIELTSQGNENRLTFSVAIDPLLLFDPQFTLGGDAINAALTTVTSQAAQGRYGITIQLPGGQVFPAGKRQILVLTAVVVSGSETTMTSVGFDDSPTVRRVLNASGAEISAIYTAGVITIARGYEGDVAPRPNGNNGLVTIADWVQTGRFVAGFDAIGDASEFQRADTAPRATLGNGAITIADWVQTGRYSSALDPIVPAGGPSSTSGLNLVRDASQSRVIRVLDAIGQRGQQVRLTVELDAQGDENAFGFSIEFDAAQIGYLGASLGPDAATGTIYANNEQAGQGRLGIAIIFPAGQAVAQGKRRIATIDLIIASASTSTAFTIGFGDAPVKREVVNSNADVLPVTFEPGTLTVPQVVTSVSAASFTGSDLAAESIVAAFGTGLATTIQIATTVPLPTEIAGTTVKVVDSLGAERLAPLFFVAPNQINYQLPPGAATGAATVIVTSGDGIISAGIVNITPVSPSLFSANATGQGLAAATALRVKIDGTQIFEPVVVFDQGSNRLVPVPIDLGPEGEQVFLIVFGTGLRGRSSLGAVSTQIGEVDAETLYFGPQGAFVGLDQGNIRIPRSLAMRGDVEVKITVDGIQANIVTVNIK
ncbi:MAG: SBBP repeat-containing protein [Acidobacteriota bacterium]|nr:MAG: SBBP repeat-containing protein [Acidobacteriota bacterium]